MNIPALLKRLLPEKKMLVQFECLGCGRGRKLRVPGSKLTLVDQGLITVPCTCGSDQCSEAANALTRLRQHEERQLLQKQRSQEQYASATPEVWGVAASVGDGITFTTGRRIEYVNATLAVIEIPRKDGWEVVCCKFTDDRWELLGEMSPEIWNLDPEVMSRVRGLTTRPYGYIEVQTLDGRIGRAYWRQGWEHLKPMGNETLRVFEERYSVRKYPDLLCELQNGRWVEVRTDALIVATLAPSEQEWIAEWIKPNQPTVPK